jgi:putative transposase
VEKRESVVRRRVDALLDAGHGSCPLGSSEAARVVFQNWQQFASVRYDLLAWVIMPNHVRLLVRVYLGRLLGTIVQSCKSYTARRLILLAEAGILAAASGRIWMRDYWDRFIRDDAHLQAVTEYIHQNPVKAQLASEPSAWRWSSACVGTEELVG